MGCITAFVRYIERQVEYWEPRLEDAFTEAEAPSWLARLVSTSPARGEAGWREWNIANLDIAQCREAALQARQDAWWADFKATALTVGGVLASIVIYTAMLAVAGAIFAAVVVAFDMIADYLVDHEAGGLVLIAFIFVGGIGGVYWTIAQLALNIFDNAPRIWTKELLPAIHRAQNHAAQLRENALAYEVRALLIDNPDRDTFEFFIPPNILARLRQQEAGPGNADEQIENEGDPEIDPEEEQELTRLLAPGLNQGAGDVGGEVDEAEGLRLMGLD